MKFVAVATESLGSVGVAFIASGPGNPNYSMGRVYVRVEAWPQFREQLERGGFEIDDSDVHTRPPRRLALVK